MNSKKVLNLDFNHLFVDDGSEAHDFGLRSGCDNFHVLSTSPCNELYFDSVPVTPLGWARQEDNVTKKRLKTVFNFDLNDQEGLKGQNKFTFNDQTSHAYKPDLNMKVDELINGFKNCENGSRVLERNKEEFMPKRLIHSEVNECVFPKLIMSDVTNPVNSSKNCNGKIISTNTTEGYFSENSETHVRPKRWGKEEDKSMFARLTNLCSRLNVSIQDLNLSESMSNSLHYKLLLCLKREMGWVGTTRQILKRI